VTYTRGVWYADGVRFTCRPDCGRCCTRHGDYDYVYLLPDDVRALASHFEMSVAAFRRRHTRKEEGHIVLRMDGPACPFLEGSRCSVYEARPRQCRTFPFWPENLKTRKRWESLATFCPGIGGGETVPLLTIQEQLRTADEE